VGLAIRNIAKNDWWHLLFESFWAIQDCWGCLGHWRRTWNPGEPPPLLHRNTVQPQDAKYNFGVFSRHRFFFVCVCFFPTTFFLGGNTTKCNMLYITYTTCFFHIINIMNHEYILMHTIPQSINAGCSAVAMRLFFTGRIHHTYQSSFCWWFVTNG